LDFDAVSTVIPGMMNVEEVEENILSSNLSSLSDEEHVLIKKFIKVMSFMINQQNVGYK